MIDWHHLFGMALDDFFKGSPFSVEVEKDLSLKKQRLDVVVLRREPGPFEAKLPDGLDTLADHNLITYKSMREPLDNRTLDELIGYYIAYCKQVSPSAAWLPEEVVQLYGVCTRYPQKLISWLRARGREAPIRLQGGVYDLW